MRCLLSRSGRETLIGANGAACASSISPVLRSSSSARKATACSTRESPPTSASKSKRERPAEHARGSAPGTGHGREAERHVRERHRRRLRGERAQRGRQRRRLLRRQPCARARGASGAGPEPEEAVALGREPLREPARPPPSCAGTPPAAAPAPRPPPRARARPARPPRPGRAPAPSARAAPRRARGTRRRRPDRAPRAPPSRSTNATTIPATSTSARLELLAQDERQQQVERALEGVEVQLELAHRPRAAEANGSCRTRPFGTAIFARRLRARPGLAAPLAAAAELPPDEERERGTKSDDDTHAFSRSRPNSCDGSTRSSSSQKRPKQ